MFLPRECGACAFQSIPNAMFSRVLAASQMLGQSVFAAETSTAKELKRTRKSLTLDQFPAKGWLTPICRCFTTTGSVLFLQMRMKGSSTCLLYVQAPIIERIKSWALKGVVLNRIPIRQNRPQKIEWPPVLRFAQLQNCLHHLQRVCTGCFTQCFKSATEKKRNQYYLYALVMRRACYE